MRFSEYSHRHGKEILELTHKSELDEITSILVNLTKFHHGNRKNITAKEYIASAFAREGWATEFEIDLGTGKVDYCMHAFGVGLWFGSEWARVLSSLYLFHILDHGRSPHSGTRSFKQSL